MHFFAFYFAVVSAITPPIAHAAHAGAALAGADPMKTGVESFRIGLAALIAPCMFFHTDAMPLQGHWFDILHVAVAALLGVYLLCCAVQGWLAGPLASWLRVVLAATALCLIAGGWLTDAIGHAAPALTRFVQKRKPSLAILAR